MFLHLSVSYSVRWGVSVPVHASIHPPQADSLPGQTPPWQTPPLGRHPRTDIPPEMATAADGTHPTGMHSCQSMYLHTYKQPWGSNLGYSKTLPHSMWQERCSTERATPARLATYNLCIVTVSPLLYGNFALCSTITSVLRTPNLLMYVKLTTFLGGHLQGNIRCHIQPSIYLLHTSNRYLYGPPTRTRKHVPTEFFNCCQKRKQ